MPVRKPPPAAAWIVLGLFSLALRVGVVLLLWSPEHPVWAYEHGEIAENLVGGQGFSVMFLGSEGATSQQAPLYPALLAVLYWVFGVGSPTAMLAMQLLQCMAGTLLVLLVVRLGRSLLPERPSIGWIAGYGAAVYPAHVYMVTHIQVAVWAALLLTLLMAIAVEPAWRGRWPSAVLAGLVAGLLLLVEPIMALVLPIVAILLWQNRRDERQTAGAHPSFAVGKSEDVGRLEAAGWSLKLAAGKRLGMNPLGWFFYRCRPVGLRFAPVVMFIGLTLAVVAPWLVRNAVVHGEFVFVKSTFGYALWQGNNRASWGTDKIPKSSAGTLRTNHDGRLSNIDHAMWEARHETVYIDDLLLKPDGYRQFTGLSEPERSRLLGRRALEFIRDNPGQYVRLCLRRLRYFLLFDETNPKAAQPIYQTATVVWLATSALGLLLFLRRDWRTLWPTVAVFTAIAAFHALTIVAVRFRIPVEPLTFLWAAALVQAVLVQAAGCWLVSWVSPADRPDRSQLCPAGNTRQAA